MNGVSVIVCCYNSAARVGETLDHLARQKIPADLDWEILVVNNASRDNTREICQNILDSKFPAGCGRVVDEPTPGLAFARKTGLRFSKFDLIIFCDDDNHLDERYVAHAAKIMAEKSDVAILGGFIKPKFDRYPGSWIDSNYAALAIGERAPHDGYVDWVFGAGMVVRKEVFRLMEERGISLHLSGRVGKKQTSGDDAEICQLARFLGLRAYYSASLVLHHKIAQDRLSRKSFIKANYRNVFMVVYFYIMDRLMKDPKSERNRIYRDFFSVESATYCTSCLVPRLGSIAFFRS